MREPVVLAIDEGTTNAKAILVSGAGEIVASSAAPVPIA
jgi:glycerol kinase